MKTFLSPAIALLMFKIGCLMFTVLVHDDEPLIDAGDPTGSE
jgi:hypothetical protein